MTTADWDACISGKLGLIRSLVGRHLCATEAEDVVQEVLVAAISQPPGPNRGTRIDDIDRWLRGLALNKIRMHRRGEGRRKRREQSVAASRDESGDVENESPLALILRAERLGLLRVAMRQLRSEDVRLMEWKYVHGWGYDQIAKKLRVSRNVVAHRLRDARERFRDAVRCVLPSEDC